MSTPKESVIHFKTPPFRGDKSLGIALVGMDNSGKNTVFQAVSSTTSQTGELSGTNKHYSQCNVQIVLDEACLIRLSSLLELNPLLMLNLNDGSALLFVQGNYSLAQDVALVFGGSTGLGPRGSEFGGIETGPGSSVYLESPSQIYVRLGWYF